MSTEPCASEGPRDGETRCCSEKEDTQQWQMQAEDLEQRLGLSRGKCRCNRKSSKSFKVVVSGTAIATSREQ